MARSSFNPPIAWVVDHGQRASVNVRAAGLPMHAPPVVEAA
jgi:hypothetical protein